MADARARRRRPPHRPGRSRLGVILVGSDHIDYLVTAAVHAGVVPAAKARALGKALVRENTESCLWDSFGGPGAVESWEDLDEEERDDEELAAIMGWRAGYTYRPVDLGLLDPAQTARMLACWRYQATAAPRHMRRSGWLAMDRLAEANGDPDDRDRLLWFWSRPREGVSLAPL